MRKNMHKNTLSYLVAVLLFVFGLAGCSPAGKPPTDIGNGRKMLPVAVRTAVLRTGEITERLQFTGELESPISVQVSAKLSGRLEKLELTNGVEVTEGVSVQRGEVIAEIEHRDLEAQLALAEAQVRQATAALNDKERERNRLEALFAQEVTTEQARDAAVAAHESAAAALEQARAQRALAQVNLQESFIRRQWMELWPSVMLIRAPWLGRARDCASGANVAVALDGFCAGAYVAVAAPRGNTGFGHDGCLSRSRFSVHAGAVFPTVNPSTRTATVEILLENERNGNGLWLLRPGMYATTEIRSVGHKNALLLPAASILRVLDRQIVFVIEGDVARARNVTVGIRSGDMVEILEGMQDGEEYVVTGQNKLTDGVKVERVNSLTSQSSSESAL